MAKRPTVFTALQITDENILSNIKEVQDAMIKSDKTLEEFVVWTTKAHLTVHVFYAKQERFDDIISAIERGVAKWEEQRGDEKLELSFKGVGTFEINPGRVIFAKVEPNDLLDRLHKLVRQEMYDLNMYDDGCRLSEDFRPHLTIMKIGVNNRTRKVIEQEHYADYIDQHLGTQPCSSLQFLAMGKPKDPKTGYYRKLSEVQFVERKQE